jgi:hypothetical protein
MSRLWSFTLNNYTQQDLDRLSAPIDGVDYLIYGTGSGSQGPFMHGTFILKEAVDVSCLGKADESRALSFFEYSVLQERQ